jgi:hypothetical protein
MQTAPPQDASGRFTGVCTLDGLKNILERLKAHADSYTATLLALRKEYLSCGRRGRDVEDAKAVMWQQSRRADTMGKLAAYGVRSMVLHCLVPDLMEYCLSGLSPSLLFFVLEACTTAGWVVRTGKSMMCRHQNKRKHSLRSWQGDAP